MPGDLRDLLHRCDSVYRNCDFAAGLCFASFIFAFVSAPVRTRIRCVGGLHATGVFADLVTRAATFDICVEFAARTTFASGRVKRKRESQGLEVRGWIAAMGKVWNSAKEVGR